MSERAIRLNVMKSMLAANTLRAQMGKMRDAMAIDTSDMSVLEFLYLNPDSPSGLRAQEVFSRFENSVLDGAQAVMLFAKQLDENGAAIAKQELQALVTSMGEWHEVATIPQSDRFREFEIHHDNYAAETRFVA